MLDLGPLKPLLTLLALPPASPLLLSLIGIAVSLRARRFGAFLVLLGIGTMWLFSCSAFASWLAERVMPPYSPQSAATLASANAQAVIVLGGGVIANNPEYGSAQPNGYTATRLRYGVWLARTSGLPLAYSGGIGWINAGEEPPPPEGVVVQRVIQQDYQLPLRWVENQARDTRENAVLLAPILFADSVRRIALVTSYPHMPRSVFEFEQAGFEVIPAPTGYYHTVPGNWFDWLPTPSGLQSTWYLLR
ncbi:MAG: YdcF family protein, partial [Roseiflexaceae bacterium]